MANTPDLASCLAAGDGRRELLPLSPFSALRYHFGMLLGVDDFETEQGYHRARMSLHNAWLHRAGVVWGFAVTLDTARNEIRVAPGLALDGVGRELHLEAEACLNVGEWFEQHRNDADFKFEDKDGKKKFAADVVIRFKACLTRQVPALMELCSGADTSTAYSRIFETIEILLQPNQPPPPPPYHRLRLLFSLDEPQKDETTGDVVEADQEVLDELKRIVALPREQQTAEYLKAFHRFAALDEMDLKPAQSEDEARQLIFPARDDEPVVLAKAALTLKKQNSHWVLDAASSQIDNSVRPSHVATIAAQELLVSLLAREANTGGALGPRVALDQVTISDTEVVLKFDQPLHQASVKADAFSVTVFDASSGWKTFIVSPALSSDSQTVTLTFTVPPLIKGLTRIIARGTGPTPLLGTSDLPMAGATTDAPAPQGSDFVLTRKRS